MAIILPCFSIATQSEMGKISGISAAHSGTRGRKADERQLFDSLVNPKGRTDRPSEGMDETQKHIPHISNKGYRACANPFNPKHAVIACETSHVPVVPDKEKTYQKNS